VSKCRDCESFFNLPLFALNNIRLLGLVASVVMAVTPPHS
jgi:hypothetical protein